MWHYLDQTDYHTIIKHIKDKKVKYKLYSQYMSRRPMLHSAYLNLKEKYGQDRETTSSY